MAFPLTAFKRLFFAAILGGVTLSRGWGQATDAQGNIISPIKFQGPDAITATLVDPPNLFNTDRSSSGEPSKWLKIDFHYSVDPKGPVPYVDAVQFKIVVEGRDLYAKDATTAEGIAVGLSGEETYINLAPNRDVYGVFYINPGSLTRWSDKDGPSNFAEKYNIHVEAYVDGKLMDYFDKRTEPDLNWYKALRPVTGAIYRQDQCCFMLTDTSRYPELKHPAEQPQ